MTLKPGDPVQLRPEHAAVRSASARTRKDWLIRIGVVHRIRRHSPYAYVIWGDNRHADQEQICVLEKIELARGMSGACRRKNNNWERTTSSLSCTQPPNWRDNQYSCAGVDQDLRPERGLA